MAANIKASRIKIKRLAMELTQTQMVVASERLGLTTSSMATVFTNQSLKSANTVHGVMEERLQLCHRKRCKISNLVKLMHRAISVLVMRNGNSSLSIPLNFFTKMKNSLTHAKNLMNK